MARIFTSIVKAFRRLMTTETVPATRNSTPAQPVLVELDGLLFGHAMVRSVMGIQDPAFLESGAHMKLLLILEGLVARRIRYEVELEAQRDPSRPHAGALATRYVTQIRVPLGSEKLLNKLCNEILSSTTSPPTADKQKQLFDSNPVTGQRDESRPARRDATMGGICFGGGLMRMNISVNDPGFLESTSRRNFMGIVEHLLLWNIPFRAYSEGWRDEPDGWKYKRHRPLSAIRVSAADADRLDEICTRYLSEKNS